MIIKRKDLLREEDGGDLRMQRTNVDWQIFWLLEFIILAVPTFATVFATGGRSSVSHRGAEVLLVVLVALTVVNLLFCVFWGAWTRLYRGRGTFASRS